MARLQILELPEGADDSRPPFVLVVDEYAPPPVIVGPDQDGNPYHAYWEGIAGRIGARAVLIFPERVSIPANAMPALGVALDAAMTTEGGA
jgi:hypothetical protein